MTDTKLTISVPAAVPVTLLLTLAPAAPVTGGTSLVAAVQTVVTSVTIDFAEELPVRWMAAVQWTGDLAANTLAVPYAGAGDKFTMAFGNVAISHDDKGWHVPNFDTADYAIEIGFGVVSAADGLVWAYRVTAAPGATLSMDAGEYQLIRSNGADGVGDPFAGEPLWAVPFGTCCTLTFDDSGVGTLVEQ